VGFVLVACAIAGVGLLSRWDWGGQLARIQRHLSVSALASWRTLALATLGLAALLHLFQAFAPPTEADTLAYHFALPKLFVQAQRIVYLPDFTSNQPLGQHMLYLAAMTADGGSGGARVAASVTFVQGLILALAILVFSRRHLTFEVGLIAALIFYLLPAFTYSAASGLVEVGLTLYTFLAVWSAFNWTERDDSRQLLLAGCFVGFAVSTKYYGAFSVVALGVALIVFSLARRKPVDAVLRGLLLFGLTATLVGSAWYVRNFINTGNPIYPALFGLLGGRDWSPQLDANLAAFTNATKRPAGNSLADFLKVPWSITMDDAKFILRTGFGPIFLALAPGVVLLRNLSAPRRRALAFFLAFAGVFAPLWFLIALQRTKHLLPIMPGLSLVIAEISWRMKSDSDRLLRIGGVLALAVALAYGLGGNILFNTQFVPVTLGMQSEQAYLESQLWNYKDVEWINENLTSEHRLLHFNRTVNFYLDVPYFYGSMWIQGRLDWHSLRTTDEVREVVDELGITHIMVTPSHLSQPSEPGPTYEATTRFVSLLSGLLADAELVYSYDDVVPRFRTLDIGQKAVSTQIYELRP
jgi:hypothetical protein